jgi:hypothetical protein
MQKPCRVRINVLLYLEKILVCTLSRAGNGSRQIIGSSVVQPKQSNHSLPIVMENQDEKKSCWLV